MGLIRFVDKIILHYSATDYENQRAAWIGQIHANKGYGGIGYHWFIRPSGLIEAGRPMEEPGVHTKRHNKTTIGICVGGFKDFSPDAMNSLGILLGLLKHIVLSATTLHGHKEFDDGLCPGFDYSIFVTHWNAVI